MSRQEFEALNLKSGQNVSLSFQSRGDKKAAINSTGHVEYTGTSHGFRHHFKTNNWANDFYVLYTNEIVSVKKFD